MPPLSDGAEARCADAKAMRVRQDHGMAEIDHLDLISRLVALSPVMYQARAESCLALQFLARAHRYGYLLAESMCK